MIIKSVGYSRPHSLEHTTVLLDNKLCLLSRFCLTQSTTTMFAEQAALDATSNNWCLLSAWAVRVWDQVLTGHSNVFYIYIVIYMHMCMIFSKNSKCHEAVLLDQPSCPKKRRRLCRTRLHPQKMNGFRGSLTNSFFPYASCGPWSPREFPPTRPRSKIARWHFFVTLQRVCLICC